MSHQSEQILIDKLRTLPPERLAEVEDFVDFLRSRDEERQLRQGAARLSRASFSQVWDNADDAAYDGL
jgi:hypothetical protein